MKRATQRAVISCAHAARLRYTGSNPTRLPGRLGLTRNGGVFSFGAQCPCSKHHRSRQLAGGRRVLQLFLGLGQATSSVGRRCPSERPRAPRVLREVEPRTS